MPERDGARDHSRQENFIPYRDLMFAGGTKLAAIARHFGLPAAAIREFEVLDDPCHLGAFVQRLVVRRAYLVEQRFGRRAEPPAA